MLKAAPLCSKLALIAVTLVGVSCGDTTEPTPDAETMNMEEDAGVPCGSAGAQLLVRDKADVEGCEWVRGSMHVPDWFEVTLPFGRLRRIDENLSFFRPHHLRNFRGLERLERVGEELSIRLDNSGELVALDGLESLREVGSLKIEGNSNLASLTGLSGLETVRGDVLIRDNTSLPAAQIKAFLSHVRVEGTTQVTGNEP